MNRARLWRMNEERNISDAERMPERIFLRQITVMMANALRDPKKHPAIEDPAKFFRLPYDKQPEPVHVSKKKVTELHKRARARQKAQAKL